MLLVSWPEDMEWFLACGKWGNSWGKYSRAALAVEFKLAINDNKRIGER